MKLNPLRYNDESEKAKKYYLIAWVIIGIVAMFIISELQTPIQTDRYSAFTAAQKFVLRTLKSPGKTEFQTANTAKVVELNDNIWEINSYFDSQNNSGALTRTKFNIQIQYDGSEWTLIRLNFEGKSDL